MSADESRCCDALVKSGQDAIKECGDSEIFSKAVCSSSRLTHPIVAKGLKDCD